MEIYHSIKNAFLDEIIHLSLLGKTWLIDNNNNNNNDSK